MPAFTEPLVAELEEEAGATRRMLERVPADRLDWQPHPKSMTLGQLALHVASLPGAITHMAATDELDAATVDFTQSRPETAEELLTTFDTGIAEARSFLQNLSEESAATTWRLQRDGETIFSMPRLGLLRTLLFNHGYHHRGQLGVYLRLLEVPLPSVYGPSADENPFAAAA